MRKVVTYRRMTIEDSDYIFDIITFDNDVTEIWIYKDDCGIKMHCIGINNHVGGVGIIEYLISKNFDAWVSTYRNYYCD